MSTVNTIISIAKSQVGYHEGYSNGHWNNQEKYAAEVPGLAWANGQPWCDTFVAWCFNKAGQLALLAGGPTASVRVSRDNWKKAGRFSQYPAVGAQVLFGTNGDAHTGIVVAYDATTITTVEGNTNTNGSAEGDGVYLKTHKRSDAWVYGYGYPKYPEGIHSADPAWAHQNPAPAPAAPAPAPRPAPAPAPTPAPTTRGHAVDGAIHDTRIAKSRARVGSARWKALVAALKSLLSVRAKAK